MLGFNARPRDEESSLLHFRWAYINLLHTFFLTCFYLYGRFFKISLRLPPSRACTHGERAQGLGHSGHSSLGEWSHGYQLDGNRHSGNRYRGDRSVGSYTAGDRYTGNRDRPSVRYLDIRSFHDYYLYDRSFNDWYLGDYDNISCGSRSPDDVFLARSIARHPSSYTNHSRNCRRIELSNITSSYRNLIEEI